jgi:signal peptidase II
MAARFSPKVTRLGWVAYGLALVTILLDQLSKAWVLGPLDLPDKGSVAVLPILRLTMVWNHGVSFGFLTAHGAVGRWGLVLFALVVVVVLGVWAARTTRPLMAGALGLVMGGAIGNNIVDRVRFGAVADFIDVSALHFPWIFNIADSAINIGVALLLIETLWPAKAPATPAPL